MSTTLQAARAFDRSDTDTEPHIMTATGDCGACMLTIA